jgi:hypothetical protein
MLMREKKSKRLRQSVNRQCPYGREKELSDEEFVRGYAKLSLCSGASYLNLNHQSLSHIK